MPKHKLQRFAELETFTNVFQPKLGFPPQDFILKGKWKEEYFRNENPIVLELGCGRGEYTTKLSQMFPQINFIGIDIKGARLWRGAKTAAENKMTNVCFIRTQIQWLNFFFSENEVSEIWLTFPDPQPQKSRQRKRLTSPRFLEMYRHILKPQGILHLKTDSILLYDYTREIAWQNNFSILSATDDLYHASFLNEILSIHTAYEKMYLKEGGRICYLKLTVNK
jgi:tRNA (guanine-N7-)-methyltransferase